MEFHERLMELRKQKGWSQEQLGEKIHVTRQTVSKWETGDTTPEMHKLIELSELFGLSIDELVGRETHQAGSILGRQNGGYYEYKSKKQLWGLPLVHINLGRGMMCRAKGIIAIGNIATGFLALGGVALGIVGIGGCAAGLISLGGLSLALLFALGGISIGAIAFGGCAVGVLALGGLALGQYAIGGCAIAARVGAGGFAQGHIAIGDMVRGTILFQKDAAFSAEAIREAITREFPGTWNVLVNVFASFFA